MMKDSLWYKNSIFYELYLRAFSDGNGDGHGDFWGAVKKLDYLKELGIDCIWILPMYPSPLKDDGYDISDYYNIHPDYGDIESFKQFVDEAHKRGLSVIADLVLNHTSDQHPWFQSARSNPQSPYRDYYVWSDTDQKYTQARVIFIDTHTSNWSWDERAGQYYWHRFYSSQPDLNFDNPRVQDEMLKAIKFWLDLGLDGFRLDAVPYLFEREGTNCENLPETHAYLKSVREYVDTHYPGRILLAEANQLPKDLLPYLRNGDFHMAFHFPLMPRIFMALKKEERQPIVDILKDTPEIPPECQWCTFLRNHDELTLEMVTAEERQWMWEQYAPEERMRQNLGIRRRLAPLLDNNPDKIALANSILFTLPGTPIIYYGDEIGMGDNIYLDDRNGLRTPMQWNAEGNAGFSKAEEGELYSPLIDNAEYGYRTNNVETAMRNPGSLWNRLKQMIQVRKEHALLSGHQYAVLDADQQTVLAILRQGEGDFLLAIHNLSGKPVNWSLQDDFFSGKSAIDLLTENEVIFQHRSPTSFHLAPYEYRWLYFRD